LRFVGGLFLAAYPPLMWTYLADVLPPNVRGKLMMICGGAGSLGSTLAPLLSRWLDASRPLGLEGWQATFAVGGIGGLIIAILTLRLPESPRWLASRGRLEATDAQLRRFEASRPFGKSAPPVAPPAPVDDHHALAPSGQAARGPDFAKRLTLVMVLQLLQPLAVIGFAALSGVVLAKKGYDIHDSLLYVGVASLGAPLGAVLASFMIDRLPRHVMFTGCAVIMAVLGLAFGLSTSPAAAMGFGMAYMVVIVLFTMTFNIYASEMFVTEVRGLASGAAFAANRVGAMLVPIALLPLLLETNATVMFGLIAATLIASALLVWFFGPRDLAGRALQ
jgi:putative MFS transporter